LKGSETPAPTGKRGASFFVRGLSSVSVASQSMRHGSRAICRMNILPVATTPITASESISNRPSRVIGSGMGVVEFFMRLASQKQARLSITEKDQFGGVASLMPLFLLPGCACSRKTMHSGLLDRSVEVLRSKYWFLRRSEASAGSPAKPSPDYSGVPVSVDVPSSSSAR
jgi:hypothetical protein